MSRTVLDLSTLPEEARREVEDFYDFIKRRYLKRPRRKIDWKAIVPRDLELFTPLKREEIYDRKCLL